MNYCPKCKILYGDDRTVCDCKKELETKEKIEPTDEVFLTQCNGVERDLILTTLANNMVAYRESPKKGQKDIPELQRNSLLVYNVYVPYSDFRNAVKVLEGINRQNISQVDEKDNKDKTNVKPTEQFPEVKHATMWKIISVVLFLAVAALVVFATDYVMSLFK